MIVVNETENEMPTPNFDSVPVRRQRKTVTKEFVDNAVSYKFEVTFGWDTIGVSRSNLLTASFRLLKKVSEKWMFVRDLDGIPVEDRVPELEKYWKWINATPEGPRDYVAGTLFAAGDRDSEGGRRGEPKIIDYYPLTSDHGLVFKCDSGGKPCPVVTSNEAEAREIAKSCGSCNVIEHVVARHVGKDRDFDAARRIAAWPDATDAQLSLPPAELEQLLLRRLPGVRAALRRDIEELGFTW